MIELNKPLKPDDKKLAKYISQVNESGWYTNFGPLHQELTERLERYLGVENLLLVSNGTLAIQVACKSLNIDSAITTPFSFVATTSSLLWQGVETAFSDIELSHYNLCPKTLENSILEDSHYEGIVATHVYGNPCNVAAIEKLANEHNKKVIYDAAHAFGVKVKNRSILTFGDASTLSFHSTKVFHTIEGGAIVFKNKSDYEIAKQLINFGITPEKKLGKPGINAKLNEYQCAVGLTLLDNIDNVIEHRALLFNLYRKELLNIVDMPLWSIEEGINGSYMPIYIEDPIMLDKLIYELSSENIQSRCYFKPSLDHSYCDLKSFGCSNSQKISKGILCLPLHYYMTIDDVLKVCKVIKGVV